MMEADFLLVCPNVGLPVSAAPEVCFCHRLSSWLSRSLVVFWAFLYWRIVSSDMDVAKPASKFSSSAVLGLEFTVNGLDFPVRV